MERWVVRVLERVQEFILSRKKAGNKFPNTLLTLWVVVVQNFEIRPVFGILRSASHHAVSISNNHFNCTYEKIDVPAAVCSNCPVDVLQKR